MNLKELLKKSKGIIFDLYHTLTTVEETNTNYYPTARILGVDEQEWYNQLMNFSEERLKGHIKNPYDIIRKLVSNINPNIPDKVIKVGTEVRMNYFRNSLINFPQDSLEILKYFKQNNKKIGLLSNADYLEIDGWNECPAKDYFDVVMFSCEYGLMKPEIEFFNLMLKKLDVTPEETIFIGDGGQEEIIGAKRVGINTILFCGRIKKLYPDKNINIPKETDFTIDSFNELYLL